MARIITKQVVILETGDIPSDAFADLEVNTYIDGLADGSCATIHVCATDLDDELSQLLLKLGFQDGEKVIIAYDI